MSEHKPPRSFWVSGVFMSIMALSGVVLAVLAGPPILRGLFGVEITGLSDLDQLLPPLVGIAGILAVFGLATVIIWSAVKGGKG